MIIENFDTSRDVLLVAEIGNNHEGSYALAEELIFLAAQAGAKAVKFQTIVPDKLVSPKESKRVEQLKRFRLSYGDFEKLSRFARQQNVMFLSTPFDINSARFLEPIVPAFKISSGDNNFYPLIDFIARTGKPIILSTGLADLEQIGKTVGFIRSIWRHGDITQELAVLHCVSSYPVASGEANLMAIKTLSEAFGLTVGYSDHTVGIEAAVFAAVLGARIIEKHFTKDKGYSDFHDHKISADPRQFKLLSDRIGSALEMLGDGEKRLQDSEKKAVGLLRRSVVANRNLEKGRLLSQEDIEWLRPGKGLPPGGESEILGKTLKRAIGQGEIILTDDVC